MSISFMVLAILIYSLAAGRNKRVRAMSIVRSSAYAMLEVEVFSFGELDQMNSASMFPIFLKLEGRPCLVVGAGTIAAPKIDSLLRAGGAVTVVAPRVRPEIEAKARASDLVLHMREFVSSDLDGAFLVVTATDLQPVNHLVAEAARKRNVLCNSVDDPPDCDFFYPSVVQRGDLQIAISTAGKSPALAQRLREEVDAMLPEDTGAWLDQLGETRSRILEALPPGEERKHLLHLLARREGCDPNACPVQQTLDRLLQSHGATTK